MSERRYLAIDAGGTTTVCLVGDDVTILGRGTAEGANPTLVGIDGFRAAIAAAAAAALRDLPAAPIAAAWLGVAGSQRVGLPEQLRAVASEALGVEHIELIHDGMLLLAVADLDHGVGLVAGTGSSAFGRAQDGRELSMGGWGYLLGDEGSGYDVAVRALRAVTAAIDGRGPRTELVELLTARLGALHPRELPDRMYPARSVTEIASLAELVLAVAERDRVAASIVEAAADDLVTLVGACARRLFGPGVPVPVVLAGGLLADGSSLHRCLVGRLDADPMPYRPITPTREPAEGGLALARAGPREPPINHPSLAETPITQ